ncbi:hypothetical protein ACIQC5_09730 [Paenarthrobacter sp. NPDC092416]|uniref:hypothetical protein n=1 Tax=Paenarthrobacter sp. NPDC092416 TaxID=3364386 RepID=UPI0037FA6ABB
MLGLRMTRTVAWFSGFRLRLCRSRRDLSPPASALPEDQRRKRYNDENDEDPE